VMSAQAARERRRSCCCRRLFWTHPWSAGEPVSEHAQVPVSATAVAEDAASAGRGAGPERSWRPPSGVLDADPSACRARAHDDRPRAPVPRRGRAELVAGYEGEGELRTRRLSRRRPGTSRSLCRSPSAAGGSACAAGCRAIFLPHRAAVLRDARRRRTC
jgi:hypothetical protein